MFELNNRFVFHRTSPGVIQWIVKFLQSIYDLLTVVTKLDRLSINSLNVLTLKD